MKRAVDIGPVDAAAIKTSGGKVRLRLLFTTEQLEALLLAAREQEHPDGDVKRSETQCNAPEKSQTRREDDDGDDARAASPPQVVERSKYVFVIEGSRAWLAWLEHRSRNGQIKSLPSTTAQIDGAWKRGWYLPTLFPPASTAPADALSDSHSLTK